MKTQDLHIDVALDVIRIMYECPDRNCGGTYTEQQYEQETDPVCGRCAVQRLDKLTLVVGRREPA